LGRRAKRRHRRNGCARPQRRHREFCSSEWLHTNIRGSRADNCLIIRRILRSTTRLACRSLARRMARCTEAWLSRRRETRPRAQALQVGASGRTRSPHGIGGASTSSTRRSAERAHAPKRGAPIGIQKVGRPIVVVRRQRPSEDVRGQIQALGAGRGAASRSARWRASSRCNRFCLSGRPRSVSARSRR
jgi:hypothetical protein